MKRNPDLTTKIALLFGDILAVTASFGLAYYYRTHFDSRPYLLGSDTTSFILSIASLLPLWVILLFVSGVYDKSIYMYRPKSYLRLLVASAIGTMGLISFSYFTEAALFPARLIAIYSFILCFLILVIVREIILFVRQQCINRGIGLLDTVVVGDNDALKAVLDNTYDNPSSGYRIVGIVTDSEAFSEELSGLYFESIEEAVAVTQPDIIMQTDMKNSNKIYELAVDNHSEYRYIPSHQALANTKHRTEIIGSLPVIVVQTTPLVGYGQIIKRIFDLIVSSCLIIIFSPIMILVALAVKITDPKGPVFMSGKMATRITRFNKPFQVYKFRSHYAKFDGKTDEEVFEIIGKPELIVTYRENGDKLDTDFRVTPVGRFIRRFSLDELPQLFNVLKGDLSLVGPRALVPHELSKFKRWHTIISVKSGLTGLAVVSGRRTISFEERRSLDVYYVQNWSFWLDISILLRTLRVIFQKD